MEQEVVKVSREKAVAIIKEAKKTGHFFSAWANKRTTGELRHYKAVRGQVVVHTNGVGLAFEPEKKGLIGVWESMNEEGCKGKDAYRFIPEEGVVAVLVAGVRYEVVE